MSLHQTDSLGEYCRRPLGNAAVPHAADRRDAAEDVVALRALQEEPDPVRHLQIGESAVLLARVVVDRVVERDREDPRAAADTRIAAGPFCAPGGVVPIRGRILGDETL